MFFKNINLHISQQLLEIERNGRYLVITNTVDAHSKTVFNISKVKKKLKIKKLLSSDTVGDRAKTIEIWDFLEHFEYFKNLKNKKPHKFAHISLTVRDRAKLTNFGDHMFCQCSQQNIFQHLETNNLRIHSLITMGMRCFCAQAQKQVDKCEIYLAISSFCCSISRSRISIYTVNIFAAHFVGLTLKN